MRVGINLGGVEYWAKSRILNNIAKAATPLKVAKGLVMPPLDGDGYPTSFPPGSSPVRSLFNTSNFTTGSTFILTYSGAGNIVLGSSVSVISSAPGRIVFEIKNPPTNNNTNIWFDITSVSVGNHINNIKIVEAALEGNEDGLYVPFFEKLSLFNFSAIRYMDLLHTNGNELTTVAERVLPSHYSYFDNGIPFEVVAAIANYTNTHPWINIPYGADTSYVAKFGEVLNDELNTGLIPMLELSNELWNFQFRQTGKLLQDATLEPLGVAPDGPFVDINESMISHIARMFVRVCQDFASTFTRTVDNVFARQITYRFYTVGAARTGALERYGAEDYANSCAINTYFGNKYQYGTTQWNQTTIDPANVNQLIADFDDIPNVVRRISGSKASVDLAIEENEENYKLYSYEGGQHLAAGSPYRSNVVAAFAEINRHPGMYDLYIEYLDSMEQAGIHTAMLFNFVYPPSKFGNWGLLSSITQPLGRNYGQAIKAQAVLDWMLANPHTEEGDNPPVNTGTTYSIAGNNSTVLEGNSGTANVTFTITRGGDVAASSTLKWKVNQTANLTNDDFGSTATPSGTLTFSANQTTKTVTVAVKGDLSAEGDEALEMIIFAPSDGGDLLDAAATTTVINDDVAFGISALNASASEGTTTGATFTFNISRSGVITGEQQIGWTVSGTGVSPVTASDFPNNVFPTGVVTFEPGDTNKQLTVSVKPDSVQELNETFAVNIRVVSGGGTIAAPKAVATINNDDSTDTKVSIVGTKITEGNQGVSVASLTVTRTGNLGAVSTVSYATKNVTATAGTDYVTKSGVLTFLAGEATKAIEINIINDDVFEAFKQFNVVLSSPVNCTINKGIGPVFISDNDKPLVSVTTSATVINA